MMVMKTSSLGRCDLLILIFQDGDKKSIGLMLMGQKGHISFGGEGMGGQKGHVMIARLYFKIRVLGQKLGDDLWALFFKGTAHGVDDSALGF
jgi:hypothetical protein